ncbi:MAG: hypothetical protein AB1589_17800 [Cyanobacteriota bacterium]
MRSHSKANYDIRLAMPGLIDVKLPHYKAVKVEIDLKIDAFRLFSHQKETLYTTGYLSICFLTTRPIFSAIAAASPLASASINLPYAPMTPNGSLTTQKS